MILKLQDNSFEGTYITHQRGYDDIYGYHSTTHLSTHL